MKGKDTINTTPYGWHTPIQIACLYAQPDDAFYRELQSSFILWQRQGRIAWLEISPGEDVQQTTQAYLHQANLVLLLLSDSFFISDRCYAALKAALQERAMRQVPVVPILAQVSNWQESVCGTLKALPDNELPIALWSHTDLAYENIRAGLARLIAGLSTQVVTLSSRPLLFQAPDLPKGYIPRPKAFGAIKHQLLNRQGNQTTAITTALRGAGGFGKTTLALALCHDREIQEAFPDGILWIELGEQPPKPLDLLNRVLVSLEPSLSRAITLEEARDRWRTALNERVCLLVIDDVWHAAALKQLLEGGQQCVRLVTTRNDPVLPEGAARIWVDAMELEEAIAVLLRGLSDDMPLAAYQPVLEALAKRLGCWPLLLTLAHGLLADQIAYGRTISQALDVVEQAYQCYGVSAFDLEQATQHYQTVEQCLEVSVRHLEKFTPSRYQAAVRYQELAIFPEDTDIPLATLRIFWQGAGELKTWETDILCMRLHQLSLLLTCDLGKGTIRLHNVMRRYLVQRASPNLPALHMRFLDASQQVLGLKRWADLPADENYFWQHLISHLSQSSYTEELQTTLTDLDYLVRKALYVGVPALEDDILLASTSQHADAAESVVLLFESLHRTIVRLSHLLRQVHTPSEMGGLLLSHLGFRPPFVAQRHRLECELPRPFLTAWHTLPDRSSSALHRTLHGHTGPVENCAVSPDGRWIISASKDRTLKIWDATTGAECRSLTGHTDTVSGCAVSPDGSFIVSASSDKALKIWDVATGAERLTLSGHTSGVLNCAVSPDGSFIVSASDQMPRVWDATTGAERLALIGHTSGVSNCAVSPDGSFIVSASDDMTLKVWDATSGAERLTLIGHSDWVCGCAVSPNGSFIVSASEDMTLKVWDATSGAERLTLIGHTDRVSSCAVSPNGSFIVSASEDKTLKVWDAATGAERLTLSGHTSGVSGCAVSPDGSFIVSASSDKTLKVWDAATGSERLTLLGHTDWVSNCAASPDGSFIVSASDDKTLKVWDAATGSERLTLLGHTDWASSCAVNPDGSFIVSGSSDKTLKVWDATTGTERFTLSAHTSGVSSCAVSPDGSFIVSASGDKTLKVWDATTGTERLTLSGHSDWVSSCAVSPNGRFIVSASDDMTLKVWDATTGAERLTLIGHTDRVSSCAVSPDGSFIVSASDDMTLKIWDVATGLKRFSLLGHTSDVEGCAVSPNGFWIISASSDKTLKVWDTRTGQCMLTFPVDGPLAGCAFHLDGEHLVACGAQGVYFLRLVQ